MNTKKLFVFNFLMKFMPATSFFNIKRFLLRWCGAKIGRNVRIVSSARFYISGKLEIGDNTWIGHEVLIVGGDAKISIGKDCDIAPRVSIISGTHKINLNTDVKIAGEGYSKDIIIDKGTWICTNSIILGGAIIKPRTILAAGGVCSFELEYGNAIYGGIPCRLVKKLN